MSRFVFSHSFLVSASTRTVVAGDKMFMSCVCVTCVHDRTSGGDNFAVKIVKFITEGYSTSNNESAKVGLVICSYTINLIRFC